MEPGWARGERCIAALVLVRPETDTSRVRSKLEYFRGCHKIGSPTACLSQNQSYNRQLRDLLVAVACTEYAT